MRKCTQVLFIVFIIQIISLSLWAQSKVTWLPGETVEQFAAKNKPAENSKLHHRMIKLPFGPYKEVPILLYEENVSDKNIFEDGFIFIPDEKEANTYTKYSMWEVGIDMGKVSGGVGFLKDIFSVNADCDQDQEIILLLHTEGRGMLDEKNFRKWHEEDDVITAFDWNNGKIELLDNNISQKLYGLKTQESIKKKISKIIKCSPH